MSNLESTVSAIVDEYHRRNYFPAVAVRVFNAGGTLCQVTAGDAREDTVFDVASLTKIATTTQILQALNAGMLGLTDGILELLPELAAYPLLKERLSAVTIQSLLTHTSAIVDWYPFYAETGDFAQVLSIALERYGPVAGMVYSDLNFMLLGRVLEALYHAPLADCLQKNLVSPLGLGRMTYHPDLSWDIAPSSYGNPIEEEMCAERGIVFTGWRSHEPLRGQANDGNGFYYFNGVAGSAGIFADARAYEKLCQFHLKTDIPVFIEAQAEYAPTRGLGWQLGDVYPEGCGHTGFTGTSIYLSRKLNIGVVAFTNRLFYNERNPNATNEFRRAIHRAVIDAL